MKFMVNTAVYNLITSCNPQAALKIALVNKGICPVVTMT